MTNNLIRTAWANVKANSKFICIQTYSGYASCRADHRGAVHWLTPTASDEEIGTALLNALSKSRFVLPGPRTDVWVHPDATFDAELYDLKKLGEGYTNWVESIKLRYGYTQRKLIFKDMKSCSFMARLGKIIMMPSHHEKLEAWSGEGISEDAYVIVSGDSSPSEIGAGVRLALDRCS
ncbi:contact-dependent growth inhibition system immunity protein [Achromobacter spanius]|uniref:contact-dependent growth inhibition system immunity protein n=1 Tax=Achromobacter spanius TaxID=217203 RepID=UPI00320B191C